MRVTMFALLATVLFLLPGFSSGPTQWKVKTDEVEVTWEFPHEAKPETGTIEGFQAEVRFDPDDLGNSFISGQVDAASLVADNKLKTKHLTVGKGYLDSKKFPLITWHSQGFEVVGDELLANGVLRFKDKELPQPLHFTFANKRRSATFRGHMDLNVQDLDISVPLRSTKNDELEHNLRVNFTIPVKK